MCGNKPPTSAKFNRAIRRQRNTPHEHGGVSVSFCWPVSFTLCVINIVLPPIPIVTNGIIPTGQNSLLCFKREPVYRGDRCAASTGDRLPKRRGKRIPVEGNCKMASGNLGSIGWGHRACRKHSSKTTRQDRDERLLSAAKVKQKARIGAWIDTSWQPPRSREFLRNNGAENTPFAAPCMPWAGSKSHRESR